MILVHNGVAIRADCETLDAGGATGPGWHIPLMTSENSELVDLPVPDGFMPGRFIYAAGDIVASLEYTQELATAAATARTVGIAAFVRQVDIDVDSIIGRVIGNRGIEYQDAQRDAQAYKDAGYAGDVPEGVSTWAAATGNTAHWAADDILVTAAAWKAAQGQIRAGRLGAKEAARACSTLVELTGVQTAWRAAVAVICSELGIDP